MLYNVTLKTESGTTNNFWVPEFTTAQNAAISHLANDRRNRATITDEITRELRVYFWIGKKLCISIF